MLHIALAAPFCIVKKFRSVIVLSRFMIFSVYYMECCNSAVSSKIVAPKVRHDIKSVSQSGLIKWLEW